MYADTRYILFSVIILYLLTFISASDDRVSNDRHSRHLFPLLGYLHGYKIGQNIALQLPPFVLSPIIIMPSVNQQQSVNVQKSSAEENYQENGATFQNISPARLIDNSSETNSELKELNVSMKLKTFKDIGNSKLQNNDTSHSNIDTFRQANINEPDVTTIQESIEESLTTTPYPETTGTDLENFKIDNVTESIGPYPNANYNNEFVKNISIATTSIQYNLTVPDIEDRWMNFNKPTNEFVNSENNINKNNSSTTMRGVVFYPSREPTFISKPYPYPRSWYNSKVDRLSITTNSYTNEDDALPPTYDDRWQSFSSLRKSYPSSGFRPLAGLYYDGFLHKSLTKEVGFLPYHSNGYYYNG